MEKVRRDWAQVVGRFGVRPVLGCLGAGCALPFFGCLCLVLTLAWSLFFGGGGDPAPQPYRQTYYAPTNGQPLRPGVPTPVYDAAGQVAAPGVDGVPGYLGEGPAAYTPYTGDNSLAQKAGYLAYANWTGQRRTPYVAGQVLSNGMVVVTGDFDFVLLRDSAGVEWFCDPSGTSCQEWRRGKW